MVKTVLSEKIVVRNNSLINGVGVFAKNKIDKGEILFIKGGHILTRQTMYSKNAIDSYWPISDDYVLAAKNDIEAKRIKLFFNHSCNPNCGIRGDIVGVSIRDIEQGEEITFDYAMLDNEYYWFKCKCESVNCRKIITSFDWKIKELQKRYKGYFATYLNEKIFRGEYYQVFSNIQNDIYNLRKDVFIDEQKIKFEDEFEGNEDKYLHCCLYNDNIIVAYARLCFNKEIARIGRVIVRKELRNTGLGKQIMFWAEIESLKLNCVKVELLAQTQAQGFYVKIGYKTVGDIFMEAGIPHIKMTREI